MRWVPLAILIYGLVLVQTSLGGLLRIDRLGGIGPVGPLLLAIFVMFLEIFVAFLQAFIFAMLVAVFIGLIRHAH